MKCFDSKELKVWSNNRNRTFTIRKYDCGKMLHQYRTVKQDLPSFEYYKNFASLNDWKQFLTTDEYYVVC